MVRDNQKKHLKLQGRRFYYNRGVPADCQHLDPRYPRIQTALRTANLAEALLRRDVLAREDDALWTALRACQTAEDARQAYDAAMMLRAARKLPRALDLDRLPIDDTGLATLRSAVKAMLPVAEAAARTAEPVAFERLTNAQQQAARKVAGREIEAEELVEISSPDVSAAAAAVTAALIGATEKPRASVTEAMNYFVEVIARADWFAKSPAQVRIWRSDKIRAARTFVAVCGDIALLDVTEDDARTFFEHLEKRMLDPADKFGFDAAKRQLGDMRRMHREYCRRLNLKRENPFDGWKLRRPGKMRKRATRVPFSPGWAEKTFLSDPRMLRMDAERRRALLVIAETGARTSEILNLRPERIHLDAEIPFIEIDTIEDGEDQRELKTEHSIREIPLVGVALAAMRKQPDGFPRLRDKSNAFSAATLKFLRANGLMESDRHTIYSARHAAEDRFKAAGLGDDMRRQILGHKIDRESYGRGYTVEQLHAALAPIALAFDPAVV